MNSPANHPSLGRRILKTLSLIALLGVAGVFALFAALWLEHRSEITLPQPTGPFAVGRAIYDWVDDTGFDPLAPVAGTKRELLIWIWYPATSGESVPRDYLPAPMRAAVERQRGILFGKFLTRDLSKVRAHSLHEAEVAPQQPSYPVVILRAGASAEVWNYTTLAEDLASQGYVVIGFDAPYRTSVVVFPDGREITRLPANNPEICFEKSAPEQENCANKILAAWTSDTAFVLDRLKQWNGSSAGGRFTRRLDLSRVGIFGHSFGGAAALQFCQQDSRCQAAINLDGAPHGSVIQTGIRQPLMILLSDHSRESGEESRPIMADLRSVENHSPVEDRAFLEIRGANHFLFSDDGALLKSHAVLWILRRLGRLDIDGRRQLAITTYCLRAFFDAHLKGAAPLPIPSPLYPEIQAVK